MSGYYVTAIDQGRVAFLVGPLQSHAAVLARVQDAKRIANQVNTRACWWAYGTSRKTEGVLPTGKLNDWLGVSTA